MASFLEHIANQYKVEHRDSLKNTCFVFPSRRASLYFKETLKAENEAIAFWAPQTFSIEEFIQAHCSELLLADNLGLILKLYGIYRKHGGTEKFDEFYSWGNVLINDFDQLDRYLVDGEKVYRNLQNIDDLEATFGPSEELIKALKSFKKVLDDGKDGRLSENFKENWLLVGKMYSQLKSELIHSGKGYMGLLYQQFANRLDEGKLVLPYEEVVFAGFNAITSSEEKIINNLLEHGKAKVFFDADRYYLEDDKEEAGHFLRKNRRRWYKHPRVEWVISDGFSSNKSIDVIGIEQQVAQTRITAELVEKYGAESTAIVMGDESLIAPLLYSLPNSLGEVNITMGFPVAGSGLANLIMAYFKYQESISLTAQEKVFVGREALINLINQPALKTYLGRSFDGIKHGKSSYLSYEMVSTSLQMVGEEDRLLLEPLFIPQKNITEAIDCLVDFLSAEYYAGKEQTSILSNGIRLALLKQLEELKAELIATDFEVTYGILDKILRESFKQLSTPFSGEPLAQLQIMGFLESRALDFDNLVLLSVNEDTIPASSGSNSYIPFSIRKAFGLPTFLDQNAIYAYHFFRLLQRAEKVTLVYSTQLSVTGGGEQSRFIYQLIEKVKTGQSNIKIDRKVWSPVIPEVSAEALSIEVAKTGDVMKQVEDHFKRFVNDRALTPTQLVDYITCPLKYYLARVLKIKDRDEASEQIDARTFGNLLHELLETAYTPWIGKEVTADELKEQVKKLPNLVEELFKDYDQNNGEARFSKNLIHHLARAILKNDQDEAPIFIHDLESKNKELKTRLKVNEQLEVDIGGFIDRLDRIDVEGQQVHRVLDYKTGRTELKANTANRKPISDEAYVETHFTEPKYKSGFQLLFYMYVLKEMHHNWQVNGGIVGVRKVNSGIEYLRRSPQAISAETINYFGRELQKLVSEIADPNVPFSQTVEVKRCEYCQFKRICHR